MPKPPKSNKPKGFNFNTDIGFDNSSEFKLERFETKDQAKESDEALEVDQKIGNAEIDATEDAWGNDIKIDIDDVDLDEINDNPEINQEIEQQPQSEGEYESSDENESCKEEVVKQEPVGFKKPSLFIDVDESNEVFNKEGDVNYTPIESEEDEYSDSNITPSKPDHNLRSSIHDQLSTPQPVKPSLNVSNSSSSTPSNKVHSESEQDAFKFDEVNNAKDQMSIQSVGDNDAQVQYEEYKDVKEENDKEQNEFLMHMGVSDVYSQRKFIGMFGENTDSETEDPQIQNEQALDHYVMNQPQDDEQVEPLKEGPLFIDTDVRDENLSDQSKSQDSPLFNNQEEAKIQNEAENDALEYEAKENEDLSNIIQNPEVIPEFVPPNQQINEEPQAYNIIEHSELEENKVLDSEDINRQMSEELTKIEQELEHHDDNIELPQNHEEEKAHELSNDHKDMPEEDKKADGELPDGESDELDLDEELNLDDAWGDDNVGIDDENNDENQDIHNNQASNIATIPNPIVIQNSNSDNKNTQAEQQDNIIDPNEETKAEDYSDIQNSTVQVTQPESASQDDINQNVPISQPDTVSQPVIPELTMEPTVVLSKQSELKEEDKVIDDQMLDIAIDDGWNNDPDIIIDDDIDIGPDIIENQTQKDMEINNNDLDPNVDIDIEPEILNDEMLNADDFDDENMLEIDKQAMMVDTLKSNFNLLSKPQNEDMEILSAKDKSDQNMQNEAKSDKIVEDIEDLDVDDLNIDDEWGQEGIEMDNDTLF